jgi:DNA-binding NtrC family response regulator
VAYNKPEAQETIGEEVFDDPRPLSKEDVQREAIVKALRRTGGRRKEAAKELFMSERTLYRKIKDLGIDEI